MNALASALRESVGQARTGAGGILPPVPSAGQARPVIAIDNGEIERMTDEAEAALLASGRPVFQHAGRIVTVGEMPVISAEGRASRPHIVELGEHALTETLTAVASWRKYNDTAGAYVTPADAPAKVVRAYRQRGGRWCLPPLTGVINAPTLRGDGSILDRPGYDPATGLLLDTRGVAFPAITRNPTRADALAALGVLAALITTFPFVTDADRSVALVAILTGLIRRSLPAAPLIGFTAPVPGSGKTLLMDVVAVIAGGERAAVISQGATMEEFDKRLGGMLLTGDTIIAVDNCTQPVGGDLLCQALTSPTVKVRRLGQSEAAAMPAGALILATGNNLALLADMNRRGLLCSLDPKTDRPELQAFASNPVETARADRARYVAAGLTILHAHHVAGRPCQPAALGSFEDWSAWPRAALTWLGLPDPVDTMEATRAADPDQQDMEAVIGQLWGVFGSRRFTVPEAVDKATSGNAALWDALAEVAGEGRDINRRRLGKWLAARKDRIVSGLCITRAARVAGLLTWQIVQAAQVGGVCGL